MALKLVEIYQHSEDENSFLLGYILNKTENWLTFLALDPAGNQGGVRFLKIDDIAEINEDSDYLRFFSFLLANGEINDPYQLTQANHDLLAQHFKNLDKILDFACSKQILIKLGLKNGGSIGGFIVGLDKEEVQLTTYEEKSKTFDDVIRSAVDIDDIVEVVINDVGLKLLEKYISFLNDGGDVNNDLDLAQIYFSYDSPIRFQHDFVRGWLVNESPHYFLIDRLDNAGQVAAVSLLNKDLIANITTQSSYLNYLNYAAMYNQQHNIFDSYHLSDFASKFDQLPTFAQIAQTAKSDHLLTVDSFEYDGINIGKVANASQEEMTLQLLDGTHFSGTETFGYENLCMIDLISYDSIYLQHYLQTINQL